jgi:hypothetical protein
VSKSEVGIEKQEYEMARTVRKVRTAAAGTQVRILFLAFVLFVPASASAQSGQMFIYPKNNQSQAQQDKDRGFDPSVPYPSNPNTLDPQPYRPSQPHVLKGAARGATLGVVGGAIGGNAGKGAAAGAAMGGMAGGFKRRDERREQAATQQQQAQSQASQAEAGYQRAVSACLDGRGYSVK